MGIISSTVGFAKDSVKEIGYVIVLGTAPVACVTGVVGGEGAPTPTPTTPSAVQVVVPEGTDTCDMTYDRERGVVTIVAKCHAE